LAYIIGQVLVVILAHWHQPFSNLREVPEPMPSAKLAPKWGCPVRPVLEMEVNTNTKMGKIGGSHQTIGILDDFR